MDSIQLMAASVPRVAATAWSRLRTKCSRYSWQVSSELAITALACASASGSLPSSATRSMAPCRWSRSAVSAPSR